MHVPCKCSGPRTSKSKFRGTGDLHGCRRVVCSQLKDVCYIDSPHLYTYQNISPAYISKAWKRWFAFEGNISYEERQALLSEYYSNMTEEEGKAIWDMVCSAPEMAASA